MYILILFSLLWFSTCLLSMAPLLIYYYYLPSWILRATTASLKSLIYTFADCLLPWPSLSLLVESGDSGAPAGAQHCPEARSRLWDHGGGDEKERCQSARAELALRLGLRTLLTLLTGAGHSPRRPTCTWAVHPLHARWPHAPGSSYRGTIYSLATPHDHVDRCSSCVQVTLIYLWLCCTLFPLLSHVRTLS